MSRRPQALGILPLLMALVVAVVLGFCGSTTMAAPAPEAKANPTPTLSGRSPMPNDAPIPTGWLPPGSDTPDEGPSAAIFPPQQVSLRFNHARHTGMGVQCTTCHASVTTSESAKDSLIPSGTTCDGCHGSDHENPNAVLPGKEPRGACSFCHLGYGAADGNRVAPLDFPRANLHFTHKKHEAKKVACTRCHGEVGRLALATRDPLPRLAGCLRRLPRRRHLVFGFLLAVTIIGILFAVQHVKLAVIALAPIGKAVTEPRFIY